MRPLLRSTVLMALAMPFLAAQTPSSKGSREILAHARAAYYNLRDRGLISYRSTMEPDWEGVLAEVRKKDPDSANRALNLLEAIHFKLQLGADDSVKLTHDEVQTQNEKASEGLSQVYGGAEQLVQGFFQTWSPFMLHPPLPDPGSDYEMVLQGDQIQIRYKDGDASVVTTLARKGFRISSMKITTASFDSLLQPQFEDSPGGLVLVGYQGDYQSGNAAETTHLQIGIRYQEVQALKLPSQLTVNGSYGGTPFELTVRFSDFQPVLK